MGGSQGQTRSVVGLGTAQRNIDGALTIAATNFAIDPNVTVMVIMAAVILLALLMSVAGEIGKRSQAVAA